MASDFYQADGIFFCNKTLDTNDSHPLIVKWLQQFYDKDNSAIGYQMTKGTDIQNNNGIYISNWVRPNDIKKHMFTPITANNLIPMCIYTTIRHCVIPDWHNDRDQYLYPQDNWSDDSVFQGDCLVYSLLCGFNNITSAHGTNHWIPFTESEVNAKDNFASHFMSDYINGKNRPKKSNNLQGELFEQTESEDTECKPLEFSPEATAVMNAGRELWRYYHSQPNANPNASFYDIRMHFQGTKTTAKGKVQMNPDSNDATYTVLIKSLRERMAELAKRIEPKVYEYGFLKGTINDNTIKI